MRINYIEFLFLVFLCLSGTLGSNTSNSTTLEPYVPAERLQVETEPSNTTSLRSFNYSIGNLKTIYPAMVNSVNATSYSPKRFSSVEALLYSIAIILIGLTLFNPHVVIILVMIFTQRRGRIEEENR